jgi:hypothetical protein
MIHDDDFGMELGQVVENAVDRFVAKHNKRPLTDDDCYMSVEVTKRGRIQLGFWRDNIDEYKPAIKFDLGALIVEQLGYLSEENDWTFDPWRKALDKLLRVVDAKERQCKKQYELEQAGKEDKAS